MSGKLETEKLQQKEVAANYQVGEGQLVDEKKKRIASGQGEEGEDNRKEEGQLVSRNELKKGGCR